MAEAASEIGAALIEGWAATYLARYASSAENLRRVLLRRARRRAGQDRAAAANAAAVIDDLVERYRHARLLDDAAYAELSARALNRRGESAARIRARLAAKGVEGALATQALAALRDEAPDPDLVAACAFARRRRLGPYRPGIADRNRDLAALARAGFSRQVAEAVLACADVEAVEALARSDPAG